MIKPRGWVVGAILLVEAAAIALMRLSYIRFSQFAVGDMGSNLTLQVLLGRGLRPGIDFGYIYGLLPLMAGRIWFRLFGLTPLAYLAASFVCALLVAWAIARVAIALELGIMPLLFLVTTLPYALQFPYPNLAHGMEAALLANALAEQSRGRRRAALVLVTAACFAKPSLGYLYGLWLLVLISRELRSFRDAARAFAPAAGAGMLVLGCGILLCGPRSALATLSPLPGVAAYKAFHFGLFGSAGRGFWSPPAYSGPGGSVLYDVSFYLLTPVGFWLTATVTLVAWAILLIRERTRAAEIVMTCAIIHVVFIAFAFGNRLSWYYYCYVLILGVAAAPVRRMLPILILLAILGQAPLVAAGLEPAHGTAQRAQWAHVLKMERNRDAVITTDVGSASLMLSGNPSGAYLLPGIALPAEVNREARRLASAEFVVVPRGHLPDFAQIHRAVKRMKKVFAGHYLTVYANAKRNQLSAPKVPTTESR